MTESTERDYQVVVVGAGVSGTACAAACAELGLRVLLLSSSLDVTGLPAYGPVVGPLPAPAQDALAPLPRVIRNAWISELLVDEANTLCLVDPRNVSLRLKWALENLDSLDLRQGIAVAVAPQTSGRATKSRVTVRTALGEEIAANACVLAPGLGLHGITRVGLDQLGGGRYGEVPADELCDQLAEAGIDLSERSLAVGPFLRDPGDSGFVGEAEAADDVATLEGRVSAGFKGELAVRRLRPCQGTAMEKLRAGGRMPAPDLPYAPPSTHAPVAFVDAEGKGLFPAGRSLGEWYLSPGLDVTRAESSGFEVCRPGYRVTAQGIESRERRVPGLHGIWATGRVAGEAGYWECLRDGVAVGRRVAAEIGGLRCR